MVYIFDCTGCGNKLNKKIKIRCRVVSLSGDVRERQFVIRYIFGYMRHYCCNYYIYDGHFACDLIALCVGSVGQMLCDEPTDVFAL